MASEISYELLDVVLVNQNYKRPLLLLPNYRWDHKCRLITTNGVVGTATDGTDGETVATREVTAAEDVVCSRVDCSTVNLVTHGRGLDGTSGGAVNVETIGFLAEGAASSGITRLVIGL